MPRPRFPVVGVGASAGGLRAFQEFLGGMPADGGIAFVLVSHLEPSRESQLPAILARSTSMPVVEATDGAELLPDHVYVIPPARFLRVADGRLHLSDTVPTLGVRLPIDGFLRSLAEDCRDLAICVILSGAGGDGSQGLRAIREVGGMCIAQDPATAEHDSMPRTAINTGLVDHVLPIARMPEAILAFARHPYVRARPTGAVETAEGRDELAAILALILAKTRSDFRTYKKPMVQRRIERRMGLLDLPTITAYLARLRVDPKEIHLLARDLLIGVTNFFREPEAFEELRTAVIAPLVAAKPADGSIRVWVPACSTGEEACSLGMLFLEELTEANDDLANLLVSTDQATIFLDTRLRVKRFTPGATKLLSLIPSDVGRPIADLAQNFVGEGLALHAEAVLRDLVPRELEIRTNDGAVYLMRVLLYRTVEKRVDGVVVTFADITNLRAADAEARAARAFGDAIVETVRDPLVVLDGAFAVVTANRAFARMFGSGGGPGFWTDPRLRERVKAVLDLNQPFEDFDIEVDSGASGRRTLRMNGRRVLRSDQGAPLALLAIEDVTDRRTTEIAVRESEERYRRLFESVSDAVLVLDGKTRAVVDVNLAAAKMYGYTREEFLGLSHWDLTMEPQPSDDSIRQTLEQRHPQIPVRWHRRKDGTVFPVEIAPSTFLLHGRPVVCGIIRDITDRKEADDVRLEQEDRLHRLAARLATAQDQEQRRIAEGLHDDVAQLLTAASLTLASARATCGAGESTRSIDEADRLIQEANERIHGLTFELATSTLYRLGLAQAVEELGESLRQRVGIRVRVVDRTGGIPLDPVTAIVLFKGVRELLFNVVKHAGARTASVTLRRVVDRIVVAVADRGKGFLPSVDQGAPRRAAGLGLFLVRERLEELGGTMEVVSRPGKGTTVTLRAPLGMPPG